MEKLYKHILVPLDGSKLAEVALKDAVALAQLNLAELTLLTIWPPIHDVIKIDTHQAIFVDEQWTINKEHALRYLKEVRDRFKGQSLKIHTVVEMGPPGDKIIEYARQHPIDLIVMATHGRSGLKRWVFGSVAEKVLRGAHLPVLLIRSYSERIVSIVH